MNELGFKGLAGSLLAGAGIGSVVLGLAFKEIAENFLSGILLAFKKPYRIDDFIENGVIKGTVVAMDLGHL